MVFHSNNSIYKSLYNILKYIISNSNPNSFKVILSEYSCNLKIIKNPCSKLIYLYTMTYSVLGKFIIHMKLYSGSKIIVEYFNIYSI